ncbi:putative Hybrid PKS-NRPS biosynthetic cluster [Aspergillus tubingensis]|nr:putative Hybrid PKS-NRPS biosynthetic cluster [Aspergillus tubingensis]GLB21653.1 putative Hybrid PKS-NRPS biosynthetic cluster [Aspergillus tubingensis]
MVPENEFNLTDDPSKLGHNVVSLFEQIQSRYSPKPAIVCGDHTITYGVLASESDRLACLLLSRGISRGHVVALALDRTPDLIIFILGVLKAGAAYVPIDPALPSERVNQMLDDEALRLVIVSHASTKGMTSNCRCDYGHKAACCTTSELRDQMRYQADKKPAVDIQGDDLAYILYTSGSTGKPKGVEVHHAAICNYALSVHQRPGCTDQDRVLFRSTISFDMSAIEIYVPLLCGATVVQAQTYEIRDPRALIHLINHHAVTFAVTTPTILQMLLDSGWCGTPGLSKLLTGGEALSPRLAERLTACVEEVWNIYGPTETTMSVATWKVQVGEDILIGTPKANIRLYVLDADMRPVPVGGTGELYISGAGVARGYRNNPERTKAVFLPDPFWEGHTMYKSGDLACFLDPMRLVIVGRADTQIKIRGQRIDPGDVEASITAHAAIANAVVINRDERLVAYCIRKPGVGNGEIPLAKLLRPWLESRLPGYMVPSFFVEVDRFPCTLNGKVDLRALPDPISTVTPAQKPATTLTEQLLAIWTDVLGHSQVGMQDNFFHIGGNSASIIRVQRELEKLLGRTVPVSKLYEHFTIANLAAYLSGQSKTNGVTKETQNSVGNDTTGEDIAVISMACRLPGDIHTPEEFWKVLISGTDAVTKVPEERWDADAIYDPDPEAPGKSYSMGGGFVRDAMEFDAQFFGISPREARAIDPAQTMILETCWEGFERAGYGTKSLRGSQTGVFIGSGNSSVDDGLLSAAGTEKLGGHLGLGTAPSSLSGRVAYALGLEGPTMTLDAGCAASLVATHVACTALRLGECDMAVAGGVTFLPSPGLHVEFSRLRVTSPDGRSRPFSADAAGMGLGEGASAVILKRLSDAQRDNDHIHAIIRGSAVNHGGRGANMTAPSGPGQERVIRAALAAARLKPYDIDYVEAHGTGTKLGDPVEASALAEVFSSSRNDTIGPLKIGSTKANIAHTQAAAGVAGLIKVALAMQHNMLPQTLHSSRPSPLIDWVGGKLQLSQRPTAWLPRTNSPTTPRRAGVNSFGIAGTNAHAIIEEPPRVHSDSNGDINDDYDDDARSPLPLPFLLSAYTSEALRGQAKKLCNHISSSTAKIKLSDVSYSLATTRTHFPRRIILAAQDKTELLSSLASIIDNGVPATADNSKSARVAMLFSGQGAERNRMGKALAERHHVFRNTITHIASLFEAVLDKPLLDVMWADPESEAASLLLRTDYAQPALFTLQVALWRLWQSWGVQPAVVLGHSVGEIAAAHVAGAMNLTDACRLVAARGKLMHALPESGGMVALEAGVDEVTSAIEQLSARDSVSIASINTPTQVVASGDMGVINKLATRFKAQGRSCKVLRTSRAFHSHHLNESMLSALRAVAETIVFQQQTLPIVSTVTGKLAEPGQLSNADYWVRQARNPVLFAEGMQTLADQGANCFVELGPAATLCGIGASCLDDDSTQRSKMADREGGGNLTWLPSLNPKSDDALVIQNSLSDLHIRQVEIDWAAFFKDIGGRRIQLPTYAFQRHQYWLDGLRPVYSGKPSGQSPSGGAQPTGQIQTGWHAIDASSHYPNLAWGLLCPASDAPWMVPVKEALLHAGKQPITVNQLAEAKTMSGVLCFWESEIEDDLTSKASEQLQTVSRMGFSPWLVWVTRGAAGAGNMGEASLWGMMRSARVKYPQLCLRIVDLEGDVDIAIATKLCSILMMSTEPECVVLGERVLVPRMQLQMQAQAQAQVQVQVQEVQKHGKLCENGQQETTNGTTAAAAKSNGTDSFATKIRMVGPEERATMLQRLVREVTAKILGLAAAEEVDMHRGFMDVGVDSLGSIQMRKELSARTGLKLPPNWTRVYPDPTSLSDALHNQSELAIVASQMGATHKFDLTSDVTHLLIGEVNTPKYKFVARERTDITVLKPEWVEAVRQSWMQGGDTDIRALEEKYRFPTFAGLSICITGFEDMSLRNRIQDTVTAHGAEFRKDLTKNVTHLIARNTEGEKYKFATQWGIRIVTVKWFEDSLQRGMVLEETLYHPLLPDEQQGAGAWNRSLPIPKPKVTNNENPSNPRPRKLRRIASAKLGDQNEGIWGDIVGTGFDSSDPRPSRGSLQRTQSLTKRPSILQESRSFASETTFAEPQEPLQPPPPPPPPPAVESREGFLGDCFFFIHGFSSKQTNVLRDHLSFNGAELVSSLSEFSRPDIPKRGHGLYTIVPYKMPRAQVPSTDDLAFECEVVTDMWLERCLDAKTLVPPESHTANTPIPSFPLKGFAGMKVCSTGFSRIDLLHLAKLVNLVGATYNEYLTPSASILICNDAGPVNPEKLRHTQEWGVPAVCADWLWSSIRNEQKQPVDQYLIQKQPTQSRKSLEPRAGSRPEQKQPPNSNEHPRPRHEHEHEKQKSSITQPPDTSSSDPNPTTKPPLAPTNTTTTTSPLKRKPTDQHPSTTTTTTQSALNQAVTSLLKNARPAQPSEPSPDDRHRPQRGRRPLLGRAPSSLDHPKHFSFSRASSIDTLNEDGCGSAVESTTTTATNSRIPSLSHTHSNQYEYQYPERNGTLEEEDENEAPPMTQLDYEDPDAVAMREKFLQKAGKVVEKKKSNDVIAEGRLVPGLENGAWGTARRTRHTNRALDDL